MIFKFLKIYFDLYQRYLLFIGDINFILYKIVSINRYTEDKKYR